MMWARVCEFMIGCWLLMSPFIFGHESDDVVFWIVDLAAGNLIMVCALASFWKPLRLAHLAIAVIGIGLALIGRFAATSPVPPAGQNEILVGLLLLMFAIIPNQAGRPPQAWRSDHAANVV